MSHQPNAHPRRGLAWPVGIAVILGGTMALNFWVLHVAGSDPSMVVEPDYYRKAVQWDDELAQRRRNVELGWRAAPALEPVREGAATLRVRLTDAAGLPLDGATVRVDAFPVARSSQVVHATLAAGAGPGAYDARLPVSRTGQWELRVEATRGADRFTAVQRVEAVQ